MFRRAVAWSCALTAALALEASGQTLVVAPVESLAFDRPEAWALKYFTSTTLLSGLETPETMPAGSVRIGFEVGWIPALTPEQRRVGMNGTKEEDLNKAPAFVRPRIRVSLPGHWTVIVAGNPPIETFGITPRLLAVGVERPIFDGGGWLIGWRMHGQVGSATGAYTCPSAVIAFPPGSAKNVYGCVALSSDVATLRYVGGELDVARRLGNTRRLTPHLAVAVNYMNGVFQVNAHTFDYIDNTRLEMQGVTVSASGGASYAMSNRFVVTGDVFYSPLTVRRLGLPSSIEGLFNVRALVTFRLH